MTPSGAHLPPLVASGEVCAWCMAEFEGAHGKPVYCTKCYDKAIATRKSFGLLPLAWLKRKDEATTDG